MTHGETGGNGPPRARVGPQPADGPGTVPDPGTALPEPGTNASGTGSDTLDVSPPAASAAAGAAADQHHDSRAPRRRARRAGLLAMVVASIVVIATLSLLLVFSRSSAVSVLGPSAGPAAYAAVACAAVAMAATQLLWWRRLVRAHEPQPTPRRRAGRALARRLVQVALCAVWAVFAFLATGIDATYHDTVGTVTAALTAPVGLLAYFAIMETMVTGLLLMATLPVRGVVALHHASSVTSAWTQPEPAELARLRSSRRRAERLLLGSVATLWALSLTTSQPDWTSPRPTLIMTMGICCYLGGTVACAWSQWRWWRAARAAQAGTGVAGEMVTRRQAAWRGVGRLAAALLAALGWVGIFAGAVQLFRSHVPDLVAFVTLRAAVAIGMVAITVTLGLAAIVTAATARALVLELHGSGARPATGRHVVPATAGEAELVRARSRARLARRRAVTALFGVLSADFMRQVFCCS